MFQNSRESLILVCFSSFSSFSALKKISCEPVTRARGCMDHSQTLLLSAFKLGECMEPQTHTHTQRSLMCDLNIALCIVAHSTQERALLCLPKLEDDSLLTGPEPVCHKGCETGSLMLQMWWRRGNIYLGRDV